MPAYPSRTNGPRRERRAGGGPPGAIMLSHSPEHGPGPVSAGLHAVPSKHGAESALEAIDRRVVACRKCPELRAYCAEIGAREEARVPRARLLGEAGPRLGRPAARVVLVGLAPGAHGSNRTGRVFTGDGSGEWLYRALHRAGFANQPTRPTRGRLEVARCVHHRRGALRAAGQQADAEQRARCLPYLGRKFESLGAARVIVTLGKIADDAVHGLVKRPERTVRRAPRSRTSPRPPSNCRTLAASPCSRPTIRAARTRIPAS